MDAGSEAGGRFKMAAARHRMDAGRHRVDGSGRMPVMNADTGEMWGGEMWGGGGDGYEG